MHFNLYSEKVKKIIRQLKTWHEADYPLNDSAKKYENRAGCIDCMEGKIFIIYG
jgi:hypothetical protein